MYDTKNSSRCVREGEAGRRATRAGAISERARADGRARELGGGVRGDRESERTLRARTGGGDMGAALHPSPSRHHRHHHRSHLRHHQRRHHRTSVFGSQFVELSDCGRGCGAVSSLGPGPLDLTCFMFSPQRWSDAEQLTRVRKFG